MRQNEYLKSKGLILGVVSSANSDLLNHLDVPIQKFWYFEIQKILENQTRLRR